MVGINVFFNDNDGVGVASVADRAFFCFSLVADVALRALFADVVELSDACGEVLDVVCVLLGDEAGESLRLAKPNAGESFKESDEAF